MGALNPPIKRTRKNNTQMLDHFYEVNCFNCLFVDLVFKNVCIFVLSCAKSKQFCWSLEIWIVGCLHLKIEFRSCVMGVIGVAFFQYLWWTASIKPRLLFPSCILCFLRINIFLRLKNNNSNCTRFVFGYVNKTKQLV